MIDSILKPLGGATALKTSKVVQEEIARLRKLSSDLSNTKGNPLLYRRALLANCKNKEEEDRYLGIFSALKLEI